MEKNVLIDSEDLYYLILELEQKLGIEFTENDNLKPEIRIHELIAIATQKIPLPHSSDCTSQQVFYTLREIVIGDQPSLKKQLNVQSRLEEWMPKETRARLLETIEARLNLQLNVLTPQTGIQVVIGFLLSCGVLCYGMHFFKVSLLCFIVSLGLILLKITEVVPKTFGDLVTLIVRNNYRILRNQRGCFNPKEVEKMLFSVICESIGFEEDEEINLETQLSW